MLGLTAPGYFTRPNKVSRGPWFREWTATDDGLEYYYTFKDSQGTSKYLLSNNMPFSDRDNLERLYFAYKRSSHLATFGGLWVGMECITRIPALAGLKWGSRIAAFIGIGVLAANTLKYF